MKCALDDNVQKLNKKPTKNQSLIIDTIIDEKIVDANRLHKFLPNMDLATVYRNLKSLKEKKVIREIQNGEGKSFYEIDCERHNPIHPHYECRECKRIYCLSPLNTPSVMDLMHYTDGFHVDMISLKFEGVCPQCR